jgi:hypothetical protein
VAKLHVRMSVTEIALRLQVLQRKREPALRPTDKVPRFVSKQISRTKEFPCRDIESHVEKKVVRDCAEDFLRS